MGPSESAKVTYGDAVEPIAIVGMACRLPGDISSASQFWEMLVHQRSGHCDVPADRFNANVWWHPDHDRKGMIQSKTGFFLQRDISLFDAPFFSITAKEAMGMDPMQRQILEVAYECFENAGMPLEKLSGSMTSVYTGVMTNDYERLSQSDIFDLPHNAASGTSRAMLSNRLSWFFNLSGPSLTLDTACSSSLYALHLACQSIRLRESEQALVAGVNLVLHPNFSSQLSSMHMLSPDGVSHSFDSRANGYARGEAIGAILVKPLSQALADGDNIRAVIRGSGANQDGKTPGITMPSKEAQSALISSTYLAAGLSTTDTAYFEAHGTGTKIGDPIELAAIGASFGPSRDSDHPIYVGSVKTNIGHTEGMAGLAGVIKAVLSLENALIPGLVGFQSLNSKLMLDAWKVKLPLESTPWPVKGLRRASVNSFGFGGANVHIILDDALNYLHSHGLEGCHSTKDVSASSKDLSSSETDIFEHGHSQDYKLMLFSMHDQNGLDRLSKTMCQYLLKSPWKGERPHIDVGDLAYTLGSRRSQFSIRSYAVTSTVNELATEELPKISSLKLKRRGKCSNILFIFTGQGAQWPLMGRELLKYCSFRSSMVTSQQYLDTLGCSWNAIDLLCDPSPRINLAEFCQPICTILQIALVDLLQSWGVTPHATVGHSSGEIGAAYAAGGISHRDAVKISYMRGYYCGQMQLHMKDTPGGMLAAGLTIQEAERYLQEIAEGSVVIGCINSPSSVTFSGDIAGLSYLEERIKLSGKFARKLKVEVAYHSPHMQAVAQDFLQAISTVNPMESFKVPMISSVTTEKLDTPAKLNSDYWVTNMVCPVRFAAAIDSIMALSDSTSRSEKQKPINWFAAIEIGPHEALRGPFNQCTSAPREKKLSTSIPYTSIIQRGKPGDKSAAEAAGLLWSLGYPVDILGVNNVGAVPRKIPTSISHLPPYPWQHSKGFWSEPATSAILRKTQHPRTDLLGIAVDNNSYEPQWKNFLRLSENPWMRDHIISGTILYPGAGMLVMALEAALQVAATQGRSVHGIVFRDVHFEHGLVIPDSETAVETNIRLRLHETLDSWYHWVIFSRNGDTAWKKHSFGLISLVSARPQPENGADAAAWKHEAVKFESIKLKANRKIDVKTFYSQLAEVGMCYGPTFTNLKMAAAVEGAKIGHGIIAIPDTRSTTAHGYEYPHVIHPATLDAIFHLIFVSLFEGRQMRASSVPVSLKKMFVAISQSVSPGSEFLAHASGHNINERDSSGDLIVSDSNLSEAKITVEGLIVRELSSTGTRDLGYGHEVPALPKRIADLHWIEDVDLLDLTQANEAIDRKSKENPWGLCDPLAAKAAAWLDLSSFKRAGLKAVGVAGSNQSARFLVDLLSVFAPVSGSERRLANASITPSTAEIHQYLANHSNLEETNIVLTSPEVTSDAEGSADLIIFIYETPELIPTDHLRQWIARLSSGGKVMVLSKSTEITAAEGYLKEYGFDRTLLNLADSGCSVLIRSTSKNESRPLNIVVYVLQPATKSENFAEIMGLLSMIFEASGITLETRLLSEMEGLVEQKVISLLELEEPLVMNWSETQFKQFQRLVLSQKYLLWVTRGGFLEKGEQSLQFSPTIGLLRTIRTEIPQLIVSHLDLSPSIDLCKVSALNLVWDVFKATANLNGRMDETIETEFVECNGSLFIPRVLGNGALDAQLNAHAENPTPVPTLLSTQQGRPLKLIRGGSMGTASRFHWVDDFSLGRDIADDEVEIKTAYVTLDSMEPAASKTSGQEVPVVRTGSGIIVRIGADVPGFEVGDEVIFLAVGHGIFRTHFQQHKNLVTRIPKDVALRDGPRLLTATMTIYHCLHYVIHIAAKSRILIHLTTQELRAAGIQIAREKSSSTFVTVPSATERNFWIHQLNLPETHVLDCSSRDIARFLKEATAGMGFDVVINDYTGDLRREVSSCVASFGKFIDLGPNFKLADISEDLFHENVSFSRVNMWRLEKENLETLLKISAPVLHKTKPIEVTSVFTLDNIPKALSTLKDVSVTGVTVNFNPNASIPTIPPCPSPPVLDPCATYVVTGGLGALGLKIAQRLVAYGSRHVLLLSRSGMTNSRQENGVLELRQQGCRVDILTCDIAHQEEVIKVVELCRERSWSIKGLVQCAMVLKDSIFQNMTFEKWSGATRPKIKGTWNLHACLPKSLDFFIVLSSMSGIIGNAAQANYAAGNTYEDALAHYRHAHGLAATTLDVGLVTDAAHFDINTTVEDYLTRYVHWRPAVVTNQEMQTVIDSVLREAVEVKHGNQCETQSKSRSLPTQILVGLSGAIPHGSESLNPWSKEHKFEHRMEKASTGPGSESNRNLEQSLALQLQHASSSTQAVEIIESALRVHIATAMTASPDDIDGNKPLYSLGVDSLKAIEVRNWAFTELKCELSVFDVLSPVPLTKLAASLARKSALLPRELVSSIEE